MPEYWYDWTLLRLVSGLTRLIGDKEFTKFDEGLVSTDEGFLSLLGV